MDNQQFSNESGTIDLNNIKLIRIKNPVPGIWKVRTSSRLRHTLRILGHGAIDFKYGFASKHVGGIEQVGKPSSKKSFVIYEKKMQKIQ